MEKTNYIDRIKEICTSSKFMKMVYLFCFTLVVTAIIASQNFFFQNIIENGISKKDIYAKRTFSVEDTKRTEMHKREIVQKVEPILVPAEDDFIKTNLEILQNCFI